MASNPLTTGPNVTSGAGENSSNPTPNPFAAQQQAILDAEQARSLAEQRAAEVAFTAAKNRPAGNGMQNPGIQATYNTHGTPPLGMPARKRGK